MEVEEELKMNGTVSRCSLSCYLCAHAELSRVCQRAVFKERECDEEECQLLEDFLTSTFEYFYL